LYANCCVCNLTKVVAASSASFFGAGATSGATTIGDDSSKFEAGVVFFSEGFEAAARVDGDGFGVIPVTGALFAGVVFATGAVLDFDEPFFGTTGEKSRSSSSSDAVRFRRGKILLGFGVGLTSAPPAATFASDGDGEGAREW